MSTKKESRKTIQNRCDKNWSALIKLGAGNKCEMCGRQGPYYVDAKKKDGTPYRRKVSMNSHHIIRRSVKTLRWELKNGLCLCPGCHTRKAHTESYVDQVEYHSWVEDKVGYPILEEFILLAKEYGSKDLPIEMVREIDEYLKGALDDFK